MGKSLLGVCIIVYLIAYDDAEITCCNLYLYKSYAGPMDIISESDIPCEKMWRKGDYACIDYLKMFLFIACACGHFLEICCYVGPSGRS